MDSVPEVLRGMRVLFSTEGGGGGKVGVGRGYEGGGGCNIHKLLMHCSPGDVSVLTLEWSSQGLVKEAASSVYFPRCPFCQS